MSSKELTIVFNQKDNIVNTSIKKSETDFTQEELYMAYKYLETVLNATEFDWGKVSDLDAVVINKEEKENGK